MMPVAKPAVMQIYRLHGGGDPSMVMLRVWERARRVPQLEHGVIGWIAVERDRFQNKPDHCYVVCDGREHPELVEQFVDTFQGRKSQYADLTGVAATDIVVVIACLQ